jgi:DNA-binding PadR family transcriptional regulator
MTNILEAAAALERARAITPTERRVLQALRDKGPGLPLEVAMRVLAFPEQIAPVLRDLQERGLVRAERFGGSPLGDELWTITPLGLQALEAAQALAQQSVGAPPPAKAANDATSPLQQEADLLRKLGELAEKNGDASQAAQYYREALGLLRKLRETPAD